MTPSPSRDNEPAGIVCRHQRDLTEPSAMQRNPFSGPSHSAFKATNVPRNVRFIILTQHR